MFKCLVFVSMLLIVAEGVTRWHTSQIVLKELYNLQKEHFSVFNDYLELETKRLNELKNLLASIHERRIYENTKNYDYLLNHLNAIKMMKRVDQEMRKIEDLTNNGPSFEALNKIDGQKDLSGSHVLHAHRALRRIQRFFSIPASDMAAGKYKDQVFSDQLHVCECYAISIYCFEDNDIYGGLDWAQETLHKYKNDGRPKCVDIEKLKFHIISSSIFTGYTLTDVLSLNGFDNLENTVKLKQHYSLMENDIVESNNHRIHFTGFTFTDVLSSNGFDNLENTVKFKQHYSLMGNEIIEPNKHRTLDIFHIYHNTGLSLKEVEFKNVCEHGVTLRTLTNDAKCQYQTKNSTYRLLMPFKEEHINSEPLIKIYHDVIYDNEIEKLKMMTTNEFFDSEVLHWNNEPQFDENKRSGQISWLYGQKEEESQTLNLINARIELFTGLSTQSAEICQVVNYGLGGHYLPHSDAFSRTHDLVRSHGNRLTTVLFYLSDVQLGGQTAFPVLNIISPAEKGAALVFDNLHMSDGKIHNDSYHGSCAILKGNKWIMTKWLHEKGQNLAYDWTEVKD